MKTLREHVTALEAAITLTLADPAKEPVHRLRTTTRRIEAQIELLALVSGSSDHDDAAKKVRKLLKRLRRAAGAVRDLDVQRSAIKERSQTTRSRHLRRDARSLRHTLKEVRSAEAKHLLDLLANQRQKLTPKLEKLLTDLHPLANLVIPATRLEHLAREWYQRNTPPEGASSDDHLHAVRKSAKLARYIAEAAGGPATRQFEALQEAGGTWHDLLTLADISRKRLGKKSPLTELLKRQRTQALDAYQSALRKHPGTNETTGDPE